MHGYNYDKFQEGWRRNYGGEMTFCLNVDCKKSVPSDSIFCPYCGGGKFSKEDPSSPTEAELSEISIENFQKIVDSTEAIKEETVRPKRPKASWNSRIAVRVYSVTRKLPSSKRSGWRPGQAARRRNFFIAILVGVVVIFIIL
jgi:hypothetical protein